VPLLSEFSVLSKFLLFKIIYFIDYQGILDKKPLSPLLFQDFDIQVKGPRNFFTSRKQRRPSLEKFIIAYRKMVLPPPDF